MTPKQKKFCAEYLIDLNATQAAIRAGYSAKTAYSMGSENLKKPEIAKWIKTIRDNEYKETVMSANEVEYWLSEAGRGRMDEDVVVTEGTGEGRSHARIMKKGISANSRIKALELMGKRHHLFENMNSNEEDEKVVIVDDTD